MSRLTTDLLKNALPAPGQRLEIRDDEERGLIFRVTDTGRRSWSLRYRNASGEQRRKSIGPFPSVSLSKAREEARRIKGDVARGADVVADIRLVKSEEARKRLRTMNGLADAYFIDAALGLHRANAKGPKRSGTLELERSVFVRLVKPRFGDTAVGDMRRGEIQAFVTEQSKQPAVRKRSGKTKPKNAVSNGRHCRDIIRQLLSYAVWKELIEFNPAHGIAVAESPARQRILSDTELRAIWQACERPASVDGLQLSKEMGIALRMVAATLCRGGEVAGMERAELDRNGRVWGIPAQRMKGKKAHLVPLNDAALDLLHEIDTITGNSRFVFPSDAGDGDEQHIDRRSLTRAMKRVVEALGIPRATPQDLRRTGATRLTSERIGFPRFIVSQVLAHASDTGGAAAVTGNHYDLNDYLPEKRRALDAWSNLLFQIVGR